MSINKNILLIILTAFGVLNADTIDIEAPQIRIINNKCGYFEISIKDSSSYYIDSNNKHVDRGIVQKPFLTDVKNFPDTLRLIGYDNERINYEFSATISVINKFDSAFALLLVADQKDPVTSKGNLGNIKIEYIPKIIEASPNKINFGIANVGNIHRLGMSLKALYESGLNVYNVRLKYASLYRIINKPINPYFLQPDSSLNIEIEYKPIYDNVSAGLYDLDTLFFESDCLTFAVPISGQGAIPKIEVEDHIFGTEVVGGIKCKFDTNSIPHDYGLNVRNIGTGRLLIKDVYLKNGEHFILNDINFPKNDEIDLYSGQTYPLRDVCFNPKIAGEVFDTLVVRNNANGPDSISILRGVGVLPGPYLSKLDFGRTRVNDSKEDFIYLRNNGDENIILTDIELSNISDFSIDKARINPPLTSKGIILLTENSVSENGTKVISIPIKFTPKSEFNKMVKIYPIFSDTVKYPKGLITNYIQGFGYLPKIELQNHVFPGRTLVNTQFPENGKITIRNTSWSAPLKIFSVRAYNAEIGAPEDYYFPNGLPNSFELKPYNIKELEVAFFPRTAGYRKMIVEIEHDAYSGREDSSVISIIEVTGIAYNKVISSSHYEFRQVLNCNLDTGKVKLYNISDTDIATIIRAEFISGDVEAFRILNNFYDEKVTLFPGNDYDLVVEFNPAAISNKSEYEAFAKVYSDLDTSVVIVSGNSFKYNAELDVADITGLAPGQLTKRVLPEFPFKPINVYFNSNVNFDSLHIQELKIEIAYKPSQIVFQNEFIKGDILRDWNNMIVYSKYITQDSAILVAEISDDELYLETGGVLFNPVFEIMLGDTNDINLNFVNAYFGNRDECISDTLMHGNIELSYCGDEMSRIYISLNNFELNSIYPNPLSDNTLQLDYTIAIDAPTEIAIYNANGKIVKYIENSFVSEGKYSKTIDLNNISSGIYFIKMTSGPFTKSTPLIISK